MFTAVIKIQKFHRIFPTIFFEIPHPFGPIADIKHLPSTPQTFAQSFPMEPPSQFQRLVLPVHHDLVAEEASPGFSTGGWLLPIEQAQLQFVPFDTLFLGPLFPPASSSIAHLAAIYHQ